MHTTFVTNLREGLSRGSPKVNNETKRNENRDDLQNVPRKTFNCLFIILLRAVRSSIIIRINKGGCCEFLVIAV